MFETEDFRHITEQEVVELLSDNGSLESEKLDRIVDQFPNVKELVGKLGEEYVQAYNATLAAHDESSKRAFDANDEAIQLLAAETQRDEYTYEERMILVDLICDRVEDQNELHRQNQQFYQRLFKILGMGLLTIVGVGMAVLGVSAKISDALDGSSR